MGQLWYRRQEAGGRVTLSHVSVHTDSNDPHSVGNRLANFEANRAWPSPLTFGLYQLNNASCTWTSSHWTAA